MLVIFKNILKWVTDPKNLKFTLFVGMIIFVLLFLQQCSATQKAKNEVELQKKETQRVKNNWNASLDSIKIYKLKDSTNRAEKLVYKLTIDELQNEYNYLLQDYNYEISKPPKVVIRTKIEYVDVIVNVPVYLDNNDSSLVFNDTLYINKYNYRYLNGRIPYQILDTNYVFGNAKIKYNMGLNLDFGLYEDPVTGEIKIKADTKFPNFNFTKIDGALIDTPENKKYIKKLRKRWGLGLSFGYGVMYDISSFRFANGPFVGLSLNYQPKFLQW